jgi:hypothetical protein
MSPMAPVLIDSAGIYDDVALVRILDLSFQTLVRARKERTLRHTRKGNRVLYKGAWVLAWLETDNKPGAENAAG